MTKSRYPQTPRQALKLSPLKRLLINSVCFVARIVGFWNKPYLAAEADIKDMTLLHKIYWVFKSGNPVQQPAPGLSLRNFSNVTPFPGLPESFQISHSMSFAAVGDLIKVEGLENSKNFLYQNIADLTFDTDLLYGNLESQLSHQPVGEMVFSEDEGPPLCCSPEQYHCISQHREKRYTVLHTACNHTMDMGIEGLETTLDQLEKDSIIDLGTQRDEADYRKGNVIEVKGIKIGFASATFGLNNKGVPENMEHVVNCVDFHRKDEAVDPSLLFDQIYSCQQMKADFIIASLHWGYEYEFFPRPEQQDLAYQIIESGADAIIAHHSHVIQPIEFYRTKRDPDRVAIIAYSLGNLTSSFSAPALVLSQVLNVSLANGSINDKEVTYIESLSIHPVVQMETGTELQPKLKLEKLETLTNRNNRTLAESDLRQLKSYVGLVLGK